MIIDIIISLKMKEKRIWIIELNSILQFVFLHHFVSVDHEVEDTQVPFEFEWLNESIPAWKLRSILTLCLCTFEAYSSTRTKSFHISISQRSWMNTKQSIEFA